MNVADVIVLFLFVVGMLASLVGFVALFVAMTRSDYWSDDE